MQLLLTVLSLLIVCHAKWGVWPDGRPPEHPASCPHLEPLDFEPWERMADKYHTLPVEKTELCPAENKHTVSQHLGNPTRVFIQNSASEPVDLYWVTPEGGEQHVATLKINETIHEKSFEGHVFHARSRKTNMLLMRHLVGLFEFTNQDNLPCADEDFKKVPLHEDSPLECAHISKGFKNSVGCKINVFFWNGTHEELASQMGTEPIPKGVEWDAEGHWPPSMHWEATYLTHRFYVRMPDGRLIEERRVGKVPVLDCPLPTAGFVGAATKQTQLTFKIVLPNAHEMGSVLLDDQCNPALHVCDHILDGVLKYKPPARAFDVASLLKNEL